MIESSCIHRFGSYVRGPIRPVWGKKLVASAEVNIAMRSWTFLTNHAFVLAHISSRSNSTGIEIAQSVGITERAVRRILADLQSEGYIELGRVGRRNQYRVDVHRPLGRIGEREATAGQLVDLLRGEE